MEAMRRGDFRAAWRLTDRLERRRRALERADRLVWHPQYLLWNGDAFPGRRVLVRCNHGLGDTLQFLRFVPQVRQMASSVALMAQPQLLGLLNGTGAFGIVHDGWHEGAPADHDLEIEIMELAYAFRCTTANLPSAVPYLPVHTLRVAPLPGFGLKVGLLWAASEWDPRRSIPIAMLDTLGRVHNLRFYSLQQGAAAADIRASRLPIVPLSDRTAALEDAAGALLGLDLLITVDSMLAHLAGAMGCPVWVLLRHKADWRWLEGRSDSPWYPSMRLFRQPREGAWEPVMEAVALALGHASESARHSGAWSFSSQRIRPNTLPHPFPPLK